MRIFQWLLLCGALGTALWGLLALSQRLRLQDSDRPSLADTFRPEGASDAATAEPGASGESSEKADFFEHNPFRLAPKTGPRPKLVAEEKVYQFDRMALGQTGKHDFVIRNAGDAPLKLAKGPTMCKCTLSQVKDPEIPPGGEIKIGLEWLPTSLGPFTQSAFIWTNDPDMPQLELSISGEMFAEVTIIPISGWVIGSIPVGTEREFTGYVHSSISADLEITELTVDTPLIEISSTEIAPAELPVQNEEEGPDTSILKAFRIDGKVLASELAGPINANIILKTNNPNSEETRLPLRATRTGPLTFLGRGWYAENQLVRMGRIASKDGATKKLTLLIDAFDEDLQLTNVNTGLPFLSIALQKEQFDPAAPKHRYGFEVRIAPGAPLGEWTNHKQATITFDTNHPKIPHFEIHVDFEIL